MWPTIELAITTNISSASYFQITVVAAFFYWLLHAKVRTLVEAISHKVCGAVDGVIKRNQASYYGGNAATTAAAAGGGGKSPDWEGWRRRNKLDEPTRQRHRIVSVDNYARSNESATTAPIPSINPARIQPQAMKRRRPSLNLSCPSCTPVSRKLLPEDNLSVINVLNVENMDRYIAGASGFLQRTFSVIAHTLRIKKYRFPRIYGTVLEDEKVEKVIHELSNSEKELEEQKKRAVSILDRLHSKMSDTVLRLCCWMFYKTLPLLFSGMYIPAAQVDMLKKASKAGIPLVFLPLHRSHIDYITVTFTLINSNIKSPLVAAGENLRIPILGRMLSGLGAFYIKRRMDTVAGQKDTLYRAILHTYMTQCVEAGHNFEIFIEGGRTRTGKPCIPKGGLLSVFVDAYLSGVLEDALLLPLSINYEKIVEGNFVRELTGSPKRPESLFTALKGIWKAVTSYYGVVRVDFNQPFSLHELIKNITKERERNPQMHTVASTASLFSGDAVDENQRQLIDSIARHIIYDCARSTAVMSTNALAFLLLNIYRKKGATLKEMAKSLDMLRDELALLNRETAFCEESSRVIERAVNLLGPSLVTMVTTETGDILIKPPTTVENVIELSYYSYSVLPHFALQGVVARAMSSLCRKTGGDASLTIDAILDYSMDLCDILQFEFIFIKACQSLHAALLESVDSLITQGILVKQEPINEPKDLNSSDSEDDDFLLSATPQHKVDWTNDKLQLYSTLMRPLLHAYANVAANVGNLFPPETTELPENVVMKSALKNVTDMVATGEIDTGESVSTEAVRNCVRLMEKWQVLSSRYVEGKKLYKLNEEYSGQENDKLNRITDKISRFL